MDRLRHTSVSIAHLESTSLKVWGQSPLFQPNTKHRPHGLSLKLSAHLHYVDDLFSRFPSHAMPTQYTDILLNFLSSWGYWGSDTKAQINLQKVRFEGLTLRTAAHSVTANLKAVLRSLHVTITKQWALSFLGLANFFCLCIPDLLP